MSPLSAPNPHIPLAERLRPKTLSEVVGQQHILGTGKALRVDVETEGGQLIGRAHLAAAPVIGPGT